MKGSLGQRVSVDWWISAECSARDEQSIHQSLHPPILASQEQLALRGLIVDLMCLQNSMNIMQSEKPGLTKAYFVGDRNDERNCVLGMLSF